jgi:ribulose 1,5-bisphosphate synthetase/thiazole synthase
MVSPITSYPHNSKKSIDAIVVGAGLAGLTAAAFLAQDGVRVLLCEQTAQVGGLFNSFWLECFLFQSHFSIHLAAAMVLAQTGLKGMSRCCLACPVL